MEFNIYEELFSIVSNFGNFEALRIFCTSNGLKVNELVSLAATQDDAYRKFIEDLVKKKTIGSFLNLLITRKGWPDAIELSQKWEKYFDRNNDKQDVFKPKAFDIILFKDNNEFIPFIGRDSFKEEIRQAINDQAIGNLRLAINGVKGVGTTYLKEYLTNLNRQYKCLPKYITIDCNTDLVKEQDEDITPSHLAEVIAYKLEIDSNVAGIDVTDPTKFKGPLFSRFIDEVKKKCEEDDGLVLFIDHLQHDMRADVFFFLDKLLTKVKEFKIPYIVILSGITTQNLTTPNIVRNITLGPFTKNELERYLIKIFQHLQSRYPQYMEGHTESDFVAKSLSNFTDLFQSGDFAPVQKTQENIKIWYEELLNDQN